MPLGYHLRTDKNLRVAVAESFQYLAVTFLCLRSIGVHTQNLDVGKHFAKQLLYLLSAYLALAETAFLAIGTFVQHIEMFAAIVTFEHIVVSVDRKTDVAIGTLGNVTAFCTHQK